MICFTWWGLTPYAARAIEAFNKVSKESVCVVATRPVSSPHSNVDRMLSCPVVWVKENDIDALVRLGETPRVLFISNWNLPAWKPIERAVKSAGGAVVAMIDENIESRKRGLKAWLREWHFRLILRPRFDFFFVPGASGRRLLRSRGVPESKIVDGLYGGDVLLFTNGKPLAERPKRMIYVGQFVERKNVRRLVQAFQQFSVVHPDWTLDLYGVGPLKEELSTALQLQLPTTTIALHPFSRPEDLAVEYRSSRIFILPSLEEHWGVVVHEAALCGCYLLLSRGIGAAADFATEENARLFDPTSVESIASAMTQAASLEDDALETVQTTSVSRGAAFGPARFVAGVRHVVASDGAWKEGI